MVVNSGKPARDYLTESPQIFNKRPLFRGASFFGALALILLFLIVNSFGFASAQEENTSTPTSTIEQTNTDTVTNTSSPTDTPTPEASPSATNTPTPTLEPSSTVTETPTLDLSATLTPTPTESETFTETPTVTPTLDCAQLGPEYAEACAAIAEDGSVRLIVELDVSVRPVSQLSNSQEALQEARIDAAQEEVAEELADTDAEVARELETVPFMAVEVDEAALIALAQSDNVEEIHIDTPRAVSLRETIPLIGADDVWNYGFTGVGQTIAILDTGIAKGHPFITADKVISEACYSSTDSFYGSTSLCPNGSEEQVGSGAGVNCASNIGSCTHGTHVAGIVAGKAYADMPFDGVAPDADLISIQVFSLFGPSQCGGGSSCVLAWDSDIIAGLERVYELKNSGAIPSIVAVNMSLGGGYYNTYCDSESPAMKSAIDNLRAVGVATIVAAGNNGYGSWISFPACISSAIAVAATTDSDQLASYSNNANIVSLLAPGTAVLSSIVDINGVFDNASYSGTSMAAPHVAGAWALLKELKPSASVNEIQGYLENSGVSILDNTRPNSANVTNPRIRVDQAFVLASPLPGTPVSSAPANNSLLNNNRPTFLWSAVSQAVSYELQVSYNTQFTSLYMDIDLSGGSTDSYIPSSDIEDGIFYFRVRGLNEYGLPGSWSSTIKFTIDTNAPAAPALTSPADGYASRGAPLHKWTLPVGAYEVPSVYQLQYDDSAAFDSPEYDSGEFAGMQHTPSFNQLGTYNWRVRAKDAAGNWGYWSVVRTVQIIAPLTTGPALALPAQNTLTNDNTPDLSWGSVTWAAGYQLQIDNNSNFTSPEQDVTTMDTGFLAQTASALTDGWWYWRVRAWNINSPSEAGAWSASRYFFVDTTPPVAPGLSSPADGSSQTTSTPRLQWLTAPSATLYQVQISDQNDFSTLILDQTTTSLFYQLATAQALDFENNYWRVRGRDSVGNWGAWSVIRSFSVSLMSSPANGFVTLDTTPTLRWLAGSGALNYQVQVDTEIDFSSPEVDQALNALTLDLPEMPVGLHYWRIRVQTSAGWSSWMLPWAINITELSQITSPSTGSTLSGASVTFQWSDVGASSYWLEIGTGLGQANLYNASQATNLSRTVGGLPVDGRTIYVRLWSMIGGTWGNNYRDYTFTTATLIDKSVLVNPAPSSTLSASSVTFQWSDVGASGYWLEVGTGVGLSNIYGGSQGTNLSRTVSGLPVNGSTIYVRLWTNHGGTWLTNDYVLTAATLNTRSVLSNPAPDSTLGSSTVNFQWTDVGAQGYWLYVGTSVGSGNLYNSNQGTGLSRTVGGLPVNGSTIYVRLWTNQGGMWLYNDYTLTAATLNTKSVLSNPAPGSTLSGSTVNFQWTDVGAQEYWLYIGTNVGSGNVYNNSLGTNLSRTISGLPMNGSTLYVRLWTNQGGGWLYNDYTFTAATPNKSVLTSPVNYISPTVSSFDFQWSDVGAFEYWLQIGTSAGGSNIYNRSEGTGLSVTVTTLPMNTNSLYVRLWTRHGGIWFYNDYVLVRQ